MVFVVAKPLFRIFVIIPLFWTFGGCTSSSDDLDEPVLPSDAVSGVLARPDTELPYILDESLLGVSGQITGTIKYSGEWPRDTLTRPSHDTDICKPVPNAPLVGTSDGVGDAIVWLVGVRSGPADSSPRRVSLEMDKCALSPRVQRVALGATLLVRSKDNMEARLRFLNASPHGPDTTMGRPINTGSPLEQVPLGDAGALVPVTSVAASAGLVEVRDDRHPWVKSWIAVAPHPFVEISDRTGSFTFDGVPPGKYVLVSWHERLGSKATRIHVETGIEVRVTVDLNES